MPKVRSSKKNKKSLDLKLFGGIFALGLIIVASAFFLGRSDDGQIDVAATITSSNEERVAEGDMAAPTPVPKNNDRPFGGLISSGKVDTPEPKPTPEVDGTATSSEDTTTSTDEESESDQEADADSEEETTSQTETPEPSSEETTDIPAEEEAGA